MLFVCGAWVGVPSVRKITTLLIQDGVVLNNATTLFLGSINGLSYIVAPMP